MKYLFITFSLIFSFSCVHSYAQTNTLSKEEKNEGWELLFDGHSAENWRAYNGTHFPEQGWKIKNGTLTVLSGGKGGTVITKKKYGDFILKLEWKISKGGNSGIFYRALEQPGQAIYWSAPEMAVLDDANYSYDEGEDLRKAGSLYALVAADPANVKPHGQWNSVKIVAKGAHIEHWQNGEKVAEYELWTPEWYQMVRDSKFAGHPAYGDQHSGYIGLQDEGYRASFRNIKIKALD